jgi:hypothetical protein
MSRRAFGSAPVKPRGYTCHHIACLIQSGISLLQAIGNTVKTAGNKVTDETNDFLQNLLQKVNVSWDSSRYSELSRIVSSIL